MLNPDNDFCYWLNTDSLAFDDAEAICAMTTGGHLASVVNQAEEDFIYSTFSVLKEYNFPYKTH